MIDYIYLIIYTLKWCVVIKFKVQCSNTYMVCLGAGTKCGIRLILKLNIYPMFGNFLWIALGGLNSNVFFISWALTISIYKWV